MEQSTINILSTYIPMVQRYKSQFSSLNTLLSKTTLTGKISSLDIAENLFDYMEKTQEKFENLQDELINTILEQNFLNAYEEAKASVQIISDTFCLYVRDCHEGVKVLEKSKESLERIKEYLQEFKENRDSYKDILLFAPDGRLLHSIRHDTRQKVNLATKMRSVLDVGNADSVYGEFCQKVDFYHTDEESQEERVEFFFTIPLRISSEHAPSLIVVLVVDLQEKFDAINNAFPYHLPQANLLIVNEKEYVLFSDNKRSFPVSQSLSLNKHQEYAFLENRTKICMVAMESMRGLKNMGSVVKEWKVCRVIPLYVAFDIKKRKNYNIESFLLEDSLLVTEKLDRVIAEGENINEELGDVVINGEIIASKSHSYALNPILNNIRVLSEEMNTLCIQSTEELQKGIYNALFNVIDYYAKYLIATVDVVFAKHLKDISWIVNYAEFQHYLSRDVKENTAAIKESIKNTLANLREAFESFYNIILFDKEGRILQEAREESGAGEHKIEILGGVSAEIVVSHCEPSVFYENRPTIIIYAYIKESNYQLLGGLAFVLDYEKIKAFLNQVLPQESAVVSDKSEVFSVIFDNHKNILVSSKADFDFNTFIQEEEIDFKNLKAFSKIIKIGKKYYLVCSEVVNTQQSLFGKYTKKTLYAMIFVAVKEEENDEYVIQ